MIGKSNVRVTQFNIFRIPVSYLLIFTNECGLGFLIILFEILFQLVTEVSLLKIVAMSLKEVIRKYSFRDRKKIPKANIKNESEKTDEGQLLEQNLETNSKQLRSYKDWFDPKVNVKIENCETMLLQDNNSATAEIASSSLSEFGNAIQEVKSNKVYSKTKKSKIKIEFENDADILTDEIKTEVLEKKLKLEPPSWSLILDNIREMRKGRDAPVDNMGCDKCMDESAPPQVFMAAYATKKVCIQ